MPHGTTNLQSVETCPDVWVASYADVREQTAFPWNDLLPELRADILARVPLLRLAQLAVLCREFRDEYRRRREAQKKLEASLPCPLRQPLNPGFWNVLDCAFNLPGIIDHFRWISPRFHEHFGGSWGNSRSPLGGVATMQPSIWPGLYAKHVAMSVEGFYLVRKSQILCSVVVELRCVLKFGLRRRSVVHTELLIDCSNAPAEVPPTIGILMGITVAPAIRTFLHELAGGVPDGLHRRGEAGAIERLRLVLPKGSRWPDVEGMGQMCDAVSTILATAWIRPSGVRICVKGVWQRLRTWKLPCAMHGDCCCGTSIRSTCTRC
jgi:hypothetical protein